MNFRLEFSPAWLEQLVDAVVSGRIVVAPIAQVELDDVPKLNGKASGDGKTVITLGARARSEPG